MRWGPARTRARWTERADDDLRVAVEVVNDALRDGRAETYQVAPRDYRVRRTQ